MEVLRTFEQSCKSAADASQKQLLSILKDNADTEYGKKYHFADISSVSEYKKQVPLSTFEDYEDFVSKMMQGKPWLVFWKSGCCCDNRKSTVSADSQGQSNDALQSLDLSL